MSRRLSRASFGPQWSAEGHPNAWQHVAKYAGRRYAEQRAAAARAERRDYVARRGPLALYLRDELAEVLWQEIRREVIEGDGSGEIRGILDMPGIERLDEAATAP